MSATTRAVVVGAGLLVGLAVAGSGEKMTSAPAGAGVGQGSGIRAGKRPRAAVRHRWRARPHGAAGLRGRAPAGAGAAAHRVCPAGVAPSGCARNLRRLGAAMRLYLRDWDDCLPPASHWGEALRPYVGTAPVWHCPQHRAARRHSYAMNRSLGGRSVHDETLWGCVLLFESSSGAQNARGDAASLCVPGRHRGGSYYLLCDGRVVWSKERPPFTPGARWSPAIRSPESPAGRRPIAWRGCLRPPGDRRSAAVRRLLASGNRGRLTPAFRQALGGVGQPFDGECSRGMRLELACLYWMGSTQVRWWSWMAGWAASSSRAG